MPELFQCYNNKFVSGNAIKCWDCRSDADSKCSDPFDNRTFAITDCDQVKPIPYIFDQTNYKTQKATMCRKIRQKGKCMVEF